MTEPLDPRVAELLSADLDGAVSPEEREAARQWVERSPLARVERESLAAVKAALGALPPVDPPDGFFETMLERGAPRPGAVVVPLRRRSPLATTAVGAAAVAAAWVLVAGGGAAAVTPPVDEVEAALAARSDGDIDVLRLAGGGRVARLRQEGAVAWGELPHGERDVEDGAVTWVDLTSDPGVARVVVSRHEVVLTLVSEDLDADALVGAGVAGLPAGDGVLDRARRACDALLDSFTGG